MNLFERLPQEDIHKLWRYLCNYGGGTTLPESDMDYFLRFWKTAKAPFFEAFGEQFIIKKAICFDKPQDELEEEMEEIMRYGDGAVSEFRATFRSMLKKIFPPYTDEYYNLKRFVDDYGLLVKNYYEGPAITIPASATKNGRPLQVNSNCKISKMIGKIADAIGIDHSWYEDFRQAHSQVLNQKTIKGNLCLSIHPLDYITMSDNNCGWSSCMAWMDEAGDYRLGTIEMMNSHYVVVAYVEAKEPMCLEYPLTDETSWNGKRWRQLYVVTPEMILGNRQYPYNSDYLQGATIKWLRELMTPVAGYGPYEQETCLIENSKYNHFGTNRCYIGLSMDYMYNDIYNQRLAYVNMSYFSQEHDYRLNLSGEAVCTGCGDVIGRGEVEASEVNCRHCNGYFYCAHCGEWCGGESYTGLDGRTYCEWCYYNELEQCECCEDRGEMSDLKHVYIQLPGDEEFDQWGYYIGICHYCFRHKCYEKEYGPIMEVKDEYGGLRYAFNLMNISDDALLYGDMDYHEGERLIKIREEAAAKAALRESE